MNSLPPDDLQRNLTLAESDRPRSPHIGLAGDTYTILLTGKDTAGRYCLFDMHVPPGGGPPPHRHDFEESFTVLEGEVDFVFRGQHLTIRSGGVVNIPANAPHRFQNTSGQPARMLCLCSPAGQENFFAEIGVPVPSRTAAPPELSPAAREELKARTIALAARYRTELLDEA